MYLRRVQYDLLKRDETDALVSTMVGADVYVLRPGFAISNSGNAGSGGETFETKNPLGVKVGDTFNIMVGGVPDTTWDFTVSTLTYSNSTKKHTVVCTAAGSGDDIAYTAGMRVMLKTTQTLSIYKDETGDAAESNPIQSATSTGLVEFWVEASTVDLVISKAAATTRYVNGMVLGEHEDLTPEDFPMGSSDEAEMINRALEVADAQGGRQVTLTKTYSVGSSLKPYTNADLRGQGWGTGLVSTADINLVAPLAAQSNVSLRDFKLDLSGATSTKAAIKTGLISGNADLFCDRLHIDGADVGIDLDIAQRPLVMRCLIENGSHGITMDACDDGMVAFSQIKTMTGDGIDITSNADNNLIGPNYYAAITGEEVDDNGVGTVIIPSIGYEVLQGVEFRDIDINQEDVAVGLTVTVAAATTCVELTGALRLVNQIATCNVKRLLFVRNDTTGPVTLHHNVTESPTANEFYNDNLRDIVIRPGGGVTLIGVDISGVAMWGFFGDTHRRFHAGWASQTGAVTSGTSLTPLATIIVDADTLQANGDTLKIIVSALCSGFAGNRTLALYANTTLIASIVDVASGVTGNDELTLDVEFTQTATTAEQVVGSRGFIDKAHVAALATHTVDIGAAEDETSDIDIIVKGQCTDGADTITLHRFSVDAQVA